MCVENHAMKALCNQFKNPRRFYLNKQAHLVFLYMCVYIYAFLLREKKHILILKPYRHDILDHNLKSNRFYKH